MEAWYQTAHDRTTKANAPLALLGTGTGRHIFFERDMAGFNNIKLQLQSMVAIAAITDRTLVLPPPGRNDHVKEPYYEFDFFDASALTAIVKLGISERPSRNTLR